MQELTLILPFRLPRHHIPAFRSSIIELTQRIEPLFHNHPTEAAPRGFWDYPLIRYTLIRGHAAVVGIGEGATALTSCLLPRLLETRDLIIMKTKYPTTGFQMNNRTLQVELAPESFPLGLHRWVALNKNNLKKWKRLNGQKEAQQEVLRQALTGHLRGLAKRLAPNFSKEDITANILRVDQIKKIRWQKADLIGFTIIAESRLRIPDGLGVGRLIAYGFGTSMSPQTYRRALGEKSRNQQVNLVGK